MHIEDTIKDYKTLCKEHGELAKSEVLLLMMLHELRCIKKRIVLPEVI